MTSTKDRPAIGRYCDLMNDVALKRVFGTPGNEELLKMLVDSILPELHVKTLTLGNQENQGDTTEDKRTLFDIKATTDDGQTLVIEMQLLEKNDFNDRMVYYSTYPIREQVRSGRHNYRLDPVYIIAIMNFNMNDSVTMDNVINCFSIRNDGDISRQLTDNVHYVTVELPKFRKDLSSLEDLSDRMIWLLGNMGALKEVPEEFTGKSFEKLFDISNFAAMTYEEQIEYLNKFHAELDRNSEMETAISKGLQRGREEGLAEGEAKGRAEANLDTARKFKQAGVGIDLISSCTGLSVEEIEAL